jgi:hypothetical protein
MAGDAGNWNVDKMEQAWYQFCVLSLILILVLYCLISCEKSSQFFIYLGCYLQT